MKIVLIGAGSESFGARMIVDLLLADELRGRDVTVALVDEDAAALSRMMHFAESARERTGSDVELAQAVDRRELLGGADYVITAVARKRMELWEQDFRVPLAHGLRHCLGENGGPGAIFHALRSFGLVLPICRDIEQLCPDALLLNFTNPEARVLHAICHLTNVQAVGLCHGVFEAVRALSDYLERPAEQLEIVSAGMNHFYCVLKVVDRQTGEDLLPVAIEKAAGDNSPGCPALFRKMAEAFGVFTFPSDDHIGEYLSFAHEFTGLKWAYGREARKVPPKGKPGKVSALDEDAPLRTSGELAVPIICDIELDRGCEREAVDVLNTERYIENLPTDCVVEVPATVDAGGVHAMSVEPLPEPFAAIVRIQCSIVELVTEAWRTRSKKLLLQALLLDPVVDNVSNAERTLDEMLALQEHFLPAFK